LQFKGLSYETQWVEYPDIEKICKEYGIPPLTMKEDGKTPLYTCPAIVDKNTGAAITNSVLIAEYLDKTYPHTPKAFPNVSQGLQFAFSDIHGLKFMPGWPLLVPAVAKILSQYSAEYFIRTRSQWFGKPLDEINKTEEERVEALQKFKGFWDLMGTWYSRTDGPFLMGDTISYADFIIASDVNFLAAAWGEESENWKEFSTWNEGKWVQLRDEIDRRCQISKQ
jgi:glutathione S-transferase